MNCSALRDSLARLTILWQKRRIAPRAEMSIKSLSESFPNPITHDLAATTSREILPWVHGLAPARIPRFAAHHLSADFSRIPRFAAHRLFYNPTSPHDLAATTSLRNPAMGAGAGPCLAKVGKAQNFGFSGQRSARLGAELVREFTA